MEATLEDIPQPRGFEELAAGRKKSKGETEKELKKRAAAWINLHDWFCQFYYSQFNYVRLNFYLVEGEFKTLNMLCN